MALQSVARFCHHGARRAQVVAFLQRLGCPGVYNVAGSAATSVA